jgi:hypothetical protein
MLLYKVQLTAALGADFSVSCLRDLAALSLTTSLLYCCVKTTTKNDKTFTVGVKDYSQHVALNEV